MADLEQSIEELEAVKQSFKANINNTGISTSSVEFRNMPNLINQMEKKLPVQTKSVNPTTSSQSITPDAGYKLTKVEVGAVNPSDYYKPEEVANVTPTTDAQSITPTAGAVFNQVNVSAVTSAIDANIKAENIKSGTTILGVTGTLEEGGGEIQGYNVESIISEDGLTQTLKITTGTGESTGGGDLIDVDELPTEGVEDNKIYRVGRAQGSYYWQWLQDEPQALAGTYTEIFVDGVENIIDPQISTGFGGEGAIIIYTDVNTYIGYVYIDSLDNRVTLAEAFGFVDASYNKGTVNSVNDITSPGIYYVVSSGTIIGVPTSETNKTVMEYNSGEWKTYSRLTRASLVGLWYDAELNEYLELHDDGTVVLKDGTGAIASSGTFEPGYVAGTGEVVNIIIEGYYIGGRYIVDDTGVKIENYVKQSELVVPAVGGLPIDITTDAEMTNALTEANVGKVYKFTGTSDTYETDAIYIVSEV